MRVLVVVILLSAASAHAEDEMPNAVPTVMDRRWSFALGYGVGLMSPQADGADSLVYGTGDIAVRYRLIDVLEIGASLTAGGTFHFGQAGLYLDLHYRLYPEQPWNPFLLVSIGASTASDTFQKPEGDLRPSVRAGIGLERRFTSWAFAAELKMFAITDNGDVPDFVGTSEEMLASSSVLGGSLSMLAIYYWGAQQRRPRWFERPRR